MALELGMSAEVALNVADSDTAEAMGSGTVAVLATPRVVALCEEATCLAVADHLTAEQTTVGMRIQLDHLAPVRVGTTVRAEATLESIQGRRLIFTVSVSDSCGLVAAGKVTRAVVEVGPFLEKAR